MNINEIAKKRIFMFFSEPHLCDWSGCGELHDAYIKEKNRYAGCKSCVASTLKAKYAKLIIKSLK